MVQIIQGLEPQSNLFGQQIGQGFGSGLSEGIGSAISQMLEQKQRKQQLQGLAPIFEQMGLPPEGISSLLESGLDPKILGSLAGQLGQQQASFAKEQMKSQQKKEEKQTSFKSALDILQRQKKLVERGHLGPKFGVAGGLSEKPKFLSTLKKEGRRDRAEYERLGKSLIQMSSNIPIRNRQEFETLAHGLFDPNISVAEIEGNLDAMQRIINNNLGVSSEDSSNQPKQLTQEIADEIFRKAGGNAKKATKIAEKMGYSLD